METIANRDEVAIALVKAMSELEDLADELEGVSELLADDDVDLDAACGALDRLRAARRDTDAALGVVQELAEESVGLASRTSSPVSRRSTRAVRSDAR